MISLASAIAFALGCCWAGAFDAAAASTRARRPARTARALAIMVTLLFASLTVTAVRSREHPPNLQSRLFSLARQIDRVRPPRQWRQAARPDPWDRISARATHRESSARHP